MRGFHGSRQMPGGEPQAPAAGGQHHATLQLHYLMMDCNDSALNTEKSSPLTRTPLDPFNSPSLGNTSFPVLSSYTLYTTTFPPLTPPSWGSLLSPPQHPTGAAHGNSYCCLLSYSSTPLTHTGIATQNSFQIFTKNLGSNLVKLYNVHKVRKFLKIVQFRWNPWWARLEQSQGTADSSSASIALPGCPRNYQNTPPPRPP